MKKKIASPYDATKQSASFATGGTRDESDTRTNSNYDDEDEEASDGSSSRRSHSSLYDVGGGR